MQQLATIRMTCLTVALIAAFVVACGEPPAVVGNGDDPEECDDGEVWDENEEECVEDTLGHSCSSDDDCIVSGQICENSECVYAAVECTSVGQECDPDARIGSGFGCEDLGRGYQCYELCGQERVCDEDTEQTAMQPFCNRGETCITPDDEDGVTDAVCLVAECDDFFDTEEGCTQLREHSPEELSDGEHCLDAGNGAYICEGAGTNEAGDSCSDTSDCAEGLTCVNELAQVDADLPFAGDLGADSFCAPACDGDEMCGDGEHCIGDDAGVTDGVGFCGDRCDPFSGESNQCGEDVACVPVSSEDGLCHRDSDHELDYYDVCTSTEQCPDNSHCFGDLFADIDESQCLPLCDPTVSDPSGTCPGGDGEDALGGDCLDLSMSVSGPGVPTSPAVGTGVCFEACEDSDDWGRGKCSGEGQGCQPAGDGAGWCMSAGDGEHGDDCSGDSDCADGYHCDETSEGGSCRSYCQTGESTNDALGCEDDEICVGMGGDYDDLGRCHVPCDPGADNTDPSCPENQQTCMRGEGGKHYCAPSGDLAHGEDCGNPEEQNCAPGMVCARSGTDLQGVVAGAFTEPQDGGISGPGVATATCRELCDPFVGEFGESGCPKDYACSMVNPDGASPHQGHCVPAMDGTLPSLQECPSDSAGMMCDENSFCIEAGVQTPACVEESYQCLQFCDYTTGAGCTGGTSCSQGFSGGPLFGWLGLCT